MDDLVNRLTIKASVMEMGEKIAWGSDTSLMREAANRIEWMGERLDITQARIAELEAAQRWIPVAWAVGNPDGTVNRLGAVYYSESGAQRHIDGYDGELDAVAVPLYRPPPPEAGE